MHAGRFWEASAMHTGRLWEDMPCTLEGFGREDGAMRSAACLNHGAPHPHLTPEKYSV